MKSALKNVLKDRCVEESVFLTSLIEAERVINSRPLTPNPSSTDEYEALSPNHFILHHNRSIPDPCGRVKDLNCGKKWKQSQFLAQHLCTRFRREYLPSLTVSHKWNRETRNLSVNDVVLLVDESVPRGFWPLARVIEVMPGRDGRVRVCKIKTKNGIYTRPVSQVCFLEGI